MTLYKIKKLSKKMEESNKFATLFDFEYNGIILKVFFFNLEEKILIFTKKDSSEFFEVLLDNDFNIKTKLKKDDYKILVNLINFKYIKDKEFKPFIFFKDFAGKIPEFENTIPIKTKNYIKYIPNHIEDIYRTEHLGFVEHKNGTNVSIHNLNKTLVFLGRKEYERCKKNNISSTWKLKK